MPAKHRTHHHPGRPTHALRARLAEAERALEACQRENAALRRNATLVARKRAEAPGRAAAQQLCVILDRLAAGVFQLDTAGRYLFANQRGAAIFGLTPAELVGKSLFDLFPAEVAQRYLERSCRLIAAQSYEEREQTLDLPAGRRTFFMADQVLADGQGAGGSLLTSMIDITERNQAARTAEVHDLYDHAPVGFHSLVFDLRERKAVEANLRESEERYRTLFETMTQGVIVYQDGRVVFANAAAAAIIGCRVDDLGGCSSVDLARLLRPDDAPCATPWLQAWLAGRSFPEQPVCFVRAADSSRRWVLTDSTATTYNGQPAVLAMLSDVTALRLTEERLRLTEARLHLLLAKTPAVIFSSLAEGDFRTTFISDSIQAVLGYTPAQFTGSSGFWASCIHPEDKARVFGDAAQLRQHGWRQYEYRCRHSDGSYRWVETGVSLLPASTGRPAEVVGYIIDITARKQADEILRQVNLDMARAARLKDEFLATMSHELRTPLTAILGYSESLQVGIYDSLTERQQEAVGHIEASGRHLLALINDILDLSKIEAGQLNLTREQFEIAEVCQASLLFVKELALKKSLQLSWKLSDPLAMMDADPRRLKQILVNLLSNAVKFTLDGGQVSLEALLDAEARVVRFAVRDTGIGIAPAEQARLFQPFVQLDSSLSRQQAGTGLGLALVRRLAELHGGSVTLESEVGAGSCFTLVLPQPAPEPEAGQPPAPGEQGAGAPLPALDLPPSREPGLAHARILLAEDNEQNILLTSDYLQARGFVVCGARTGREALAAAVEQSPDLILMDIQLPELDGLELMRRLRALPVFVATPIIALTALAMPGDRERCLEAGASAYLTKPVRYQELVATIRRLLMR